MFGNESLEFCRVCGETNSAGWHLGAITCEACKKFYMRNINNGELKLECAYNNKCVITKTTRMQCAFCRFKKCVQVGMTQNAEGQSNVQPVSFRNLACEVCKRTASGVHFGVLTCEGCKGFFRRSVDQNFICQSGQSGSCDVSQFSRNKFREIGCRACRLKRCVDAGMNQNNSKIGRQSNLFKLKLRSLADGTPDSSASSSTYSNPEQASSEFSPIGQNNVVALGANVEVMLDNETSDFVRLVVHAYKSLASIPRADYTDKESVEEKMSCAFNTLVFSCNNFLKNLPCFFEKFSELDQYCLIVNSVHPIRLLQVVYHSVQCNSQVNYFNCNESIYKQICVIHPVFNQIADYMQVVIELFRVIKLDTTELALFSAFLAFTSCRGLQDTSRCMEINSRLCTVLQSYMFARRNENDTIRQLINLSIRFSKVCSVLHSNFYNKCRSSTISYCSTDIYQANLVRSNAKTC